MFKMYNVNALEINLVTYLPNVKISFGLSRPMLSHWRCMSPTGFFLKIFLLVVGIVTI